MIQAEFLADKQGLKGFRIGGHAGYADAGEDIVCASVTSAVQLTANTITEIFGTAAELKVMENVIECTLPQNAPQAVQKLLEGLKLHLEILSEDYEGTIKIKVLEVF